MPASERGTGGMLSAAQDAAPLLWEDPGHQPATRAFLWGAVELLRSPRTFFGRMALSGGLHEPLTFFLIALGLLIVVSFPATLAHLAATGPDVTQVGPSAYDAHALPSKIAGICLVLLPVILGAGACLAVAGGTLFYLPGRLFGSRSWEGSVSIWLYSLSAALLPLLMAAAAVMVVSCGAYLTGGLWPNANETAGTVARVTGVAALAAAIPGALIILVKNAVTGCIHAFGVDGSTGAAAAISGLTLLVGVLAGTAMALHRMSPPRGAATAAAAVLAASVIAIACATRSRRDWRAD
jgi:hypothetical protein